MSMKRMAGLLLCAVMMLAMFGCGASSGGTEQIQNNNTPVKSTDEIQGLWSSKSENGDEHLLLIRGSQIFGFRKINDMKEYESGVSNFFSSLLYNAERSEAESAASLDDLCGIILMSGAVVNFSSQYTSIEHLFLDDDGCLWRESYNKYTKISDSTAFPGFFTEIVTPYWNSIQKTQAFSKKYADLPTNRDVKYDPVGYLGKPFVITGVAKLDDYYNFDYMGLEGVYFCINIVPNGGNISDRWFIYADRTQFRELFEMLKDGECSLTLVGKTQYLDAAKYSLATLVDYYSGN